MWCSNSSHWDSNAETYGMLRETSAVRYCLGCITTSANNRVLLSLIRSPDPHSVSDVVLLMLQEMIMKSRLLEDETKKILSSLKVSYFNIFQPLLKWPS